MRMHPFEQDYSNKEQTSSCSCAKCISNICTFFFSSQSEQLQKTRETSRRNNDCMHLLFYHAQFELTNQIVQLEVNDS